MHRSHSDEVGDSLVEIVMALVIIGVVIGAFVATFSTGATASSAHKNLVTADVVLRNYAEAAKTAARSCSTGGPFAIVYPPPLPTGFRVGSDLGGSPRCPDPRTAMPVKLTVTLPNGNTKSMSVDVRTP